MPPRRARGNAQMTKPRGTMKKFILLAISVLFFAYAASSEAATGLDKYKGAFGPKIKGIQLGVPVTIPEFMKLANQHLAYDAFYDGGWFLVAYNSIDEFLADVDSNITSYYGNRVLILNDSKNKRWKFDGSYPEYKEFLARPVSASLPGQRRIWWQCDLSKAVDGCQVRQ
jgi:hypothetical protein